MRYKCFYCKKIVKQDRKQYNPEDMHLTCSSCWKKSEYRNKSLANLNKRLGKVMNK